MNYKAIIKKQGTLIVIGVICLTLIGSGLTYALFFQVETNSNNQVIKAGSLNVEYGASSSSIIGAEMEPLADDEALEGQAQTSTIYLENTGTLPALYELTIGNNIEAFENRAGYSENDKLIDHQYLRVAAYLDGKLVVRPTTLKDLPKSSEGVDMYTLYNSSLNVTTTGESTGTLVLKVWISEDAPITVKDNFVYLKLDVISQVDETQNSNEN